MKNDKIQTIENELLVMAAQNGNAKAMDELVNRWQKRLWSHAYRLTASQQGSWDITQESWMAIIKNLKKLNDTSAFKSWIYKITTNKAINWIKKTQKERKCTQLDQNQPENSSNNTDIGLEELIQKLDFKKRIVLNLCYFEDMSISAISKILKIPEGTVKSRLSKARSELKNYWTIKEQNHGKQRLTKNIK
ncbi:MAG: RNA polymerase sigma factor [Phycisphaerae bacterium]|nr:RNA polymerase sigma factor [Phycisphaerae bacterium]